MTALFWRDRDKENKTDAVNSSTQDEVGVRPQPVDEIIDLMDEGMLLLTDALVPAMANAAARRMLNLISHSLPAHIQSDELMSVARRAVAEQTAIEAEFTLWPERRDVRVRAIPLPDHDAVAVFLRDISEEVRLQRMRRQFVVNASHELKTPAAGLQTLAEAVLQAQTDDPAGARRLSQRLVVEAERLGRLTQDLLDLSRLEEPAPPTRVEVDLADVAGQEVARLREIAAGKGVLLRTEAPERVSVSGDRQQLGLMIRNLLDNAIRYTDGGGTVSIEIERDDGDVVVRVVDNGIGIPLRAQARVFERFYRVDDDRARTSGGTGLGLSIVKHVAELHGGRVTLDSELGEGSVFAVHLPVEA